MADGVGWFDQRAKSQGAANFLALDESARSAAVEAAFASDDEDVKQFVVLLRFYAGFNYYSHPTIKAAFPYTDPPQPEGFADFQDPPQMKNEAEWDAVVVGAGAGGAAAAYGLCQRGMSVLLLDAGPQFNPIVDYPLTESDWETHDFPEKPGSAASVTFAPGQKLTGAEPLLVSGSRGWAHWLQAARAGWKNTITSAALAALRCILPVNRIACTPMR